MADRPRNYEELRRAHREAEENQRRADAANKRDAQQEEPTRPAPREVRREDAPGLGHRGTTRSEPGREVGNRSKDQQADSQREEEAQAHAEQKTQMNKLVQQEEESEASRENEAEVESEAEPEPGEEPEP